jgi:3-hydroxyisobutyrate dehydrogenase-like beta-hydroxyacid dehydrogenase
LARSPALRDDEGTGDAHDDATPGFALRGAVKDVVLARAAAGDRASSSRSPTPSGRWSPAAADGLGDSDVSAVVRLAGDLPVNDGEAPAIGDDESPEDRPS